MAQTLLYEGSSEFGHYRIFDMTYEGRTARVLYAGVSAPESGIACDDEPELLFDYNQRFLEIAQSTIPKSVLIIGGGVLTLPKALLERFGEIKIDVVEIDSLLIDLAREYFDVPEDPRLNIIIGDGRKYLDTCQTQYDLIVVDAFSEYDIPESLLSTDAISRYTDILTSTGIVTMNFIAKYYTYRANLAHSLYAKFASIFEYVDLYPADYHYSKHEEQNIILVASRVPADNLDYLQSVSVKLLDTK